METKSTRSGATRLDSRQNSRGRISKYAVPMAAAVASLALVGSVRAADQVLWTFDTAGNTQGVNIWFQGGGGESTTVQVDNTVVPADPFQATASAGALGIQTNSNSSTTSFAQTFVANFNFSSNPPTGAQVLNFQNLSMDMYLPSSFFNAGTLNVRLGFGYNTGPSTAEVTTFDPEVGNGGGIFADLTKLDQWQTVVVPYPTNPTTVQPGAVNSGNIETFLIFQDGSVVTTKGFFIDNVKLVNPINTNGNATWNPANDGDWSSSVNWSGGIVPNGSDNIATFGPGNSVTRNVTLSQQEIAGTVNFNSGTSYVLGGTGTLTLTSSTANPGINVTAGNHTISAALSLPAGTTDLNVAASSSLTVTNLQTQFQIVNKNGPGLLSINKITQSTLQVNGGTLKLQPGGGTSGLFFLGLNAAGVVMDITNNSITSGYGDPNTIQNTRTQIGAAFAGGSWTGTTSPATANGVVTSSTAAAVAANGADVHKSGVGYADAAVLGAGNTYIGGTVPTGTNVIYSYTLYGDANLDGTVSTADFSMLAGGFGMNSGTQVWTSGDFNYDGVVNALDFNMLAANYGATLPQSAPVLGALVPEPTSLATLLIGGALLGRSRKQSKAK